MAIFAFLLAKNNRNSTEDVEILHLVKFIGIIISGCREKVKNAYTNTNMVEDFEIMRSS